FGSELAADTAVALDLRARGRRDLQERHALALVGIEGEELLIGLKAQRQAFAVIEPIDADDHAAVMQIVPHAVEPAGLEIALGGLAEALDIDADREDTGLHPILIEAERGLAGQRGRELGGRIIAEAQKVVAGL